MSLTGPARLLHPALALLALAFSPASAQAQSGNPVPAETPPAGTVESIRAMQAGEFVWLPQLAPKGPVLLVVSIKEQRAVVYRNGIPIGVSTVSTGKEGHETPTGVFTILQKRIEHYSNLYNNAPMPYMQRLTWSGIALHAGNLPGYPASHGCIRLPLEFSRKLYDVTRLGMTVVVAGDEAVPRIGPTPDFLDGTGDGAGSAVVSRSARGQSTWTPAAATSGPVSVVISAADRQLVVLRDGKRIGSAPVGIAGTVGKLRVFTLAGVQGGQFQWLEVGLSGPDATATDAVPDSERERLTIEPAFRERLKSVLQPGATLIVSPDSLSAASSQQALTVIDSSAPPGD